MSKKTQYDMTGFSKPNDSGADSRNDSRVVDSKGFNIKDIFWLCVSRWYWFVISLAITCGYGVYYIASTPKLYLSSADLLVKDNAGSAPDVSATLSDITGLNSNVNINNEMVALKSPVNAIEVVNRLGLDVDYVVRHRLRDRVLYGTDLPFTVKFLDLGENGQAVIDASYNPDEVVKMRPVSMGDVMLSENKDNEFEVDLSAQSGDTLHTVFGRLIVKKNPALSSAFNVPLNITVDRVGQNAGVAMIRKALKTDVRDVYSSVINITYTDVNTERANAILKCLIEVYNENWIADRNQISVSTSNFINERLAVIEKELGSVDTDISQYKSENQITDIAAISSKFFDRALNASDEVAKLTATRTLARQIRDHLSNVANSYNVLPASTGLNNVGIEGQIANYNKLLVERNALIANSSEQNPVIERYDAQLDAARQAMLSAIDGYIDILNSEIAGSQSMQAASSSRLAANPTQAKHLLTLGRQQEVKEQLYLYLLQKREENELSQAFTAYNSKLITPPSASGPISPDNTNVMTMAIAIGLVIPAGLIFLTELLNTKVRGRRDLDMFTVPFAGEIPLSSKPRTRMQKLLGKPGKTPDRATILVKKGSNNVINEAFRVIRTNLEFMVPGDGNEARTIMITSFNAGSGKTFISCNLAAVLALKGNKVALLDLDLRKGSLSGLVGKPSVGIANYLAGNGDPKDFVIQNLDGCEGLDLYPAGPIPPNPAELLYNDRLPQLIDKLRREYDFIILDCPPAEIVADAKIINRVTDITLMVIRAGLIERAMLPELQKFYDTARYKHISVILNGTIDPTESRLYRGNRFGYGYGYGYGYRYGSDTDGKKKSKSSK